MDSVNITFHGNTYKFPKNVSLLEASKNFSNQYKNEILVGRINTDIEPLDYLLTEDCDIDFYDLSSFVGNKVYERSAILILVKAVKDILNEEVKVEHSIDKGIYCTINNLDLNKTNSILNRMREIVNNNMPIEKLTANRLKTMQYYNCVNMKDKEELLKYISNTYITIYKLDNIYDYMFGEMVLSTGYIKEFNLEYVKDNGCVLMFPFIFGDNKLTKYIHHNKLFDATIDYLNWSHKVGINTVADLNKKLAEGNWNDLVFISETMYNKTLIDIAKTISENKNIRIVLISGPSCSGKTTTSKKLKIYLEAQGLKPHAISVDDYFKERDETPLDNNGNKDFESINAVDINLFNEQLNKLLNYEEVNIPTFNFITGKKEYKNKLTLSQNGILIIEGLHSLNDNLTATISSDKKYKIYMSPLTSINLDNHNRLSTSDNRLVRRIVRDNQKRGYNASETLDQWKRVRSGETNFVFPYQDSADIVVNTSLIYEMSVLKVYAEPLLFSVKENDLNYVEAIRLINELRMILPMPGSSIPLDSIIREFIGNSCFEE